jgi:hypothetical protein
MSADKQNSSALDLIEAFRHDVQASLGRSVERDDRSTLALAVLAKYLQMYSEALIKKDLTEKEKLLMTQSHRLPGLFFETAQIVGTHHDYDKEKIKEANQRMIELFDIGMRLTMEMRQQGVDAGKVRL